MNVSNACKILFILGLFVELSFGQFPTKTFSCRNGEYIESNQFCDDISQCSDGSDEPVNCTLNKQPCGVGKFYCPANKKCVDADLFSDIPNQMLCHNQSQPNGVECSEIFNEFNRTVLNILKAVSPQKEAKYSCNHTRCLDMNRFKCYCSCFKTSSLELNFDETQNINATFEANNCSFQNEKFLCKDEKRCLNLEYVCDGYCNCFDCSDEHDNCSKVDHETLSSCSHSYFPTPLGPQCIGNLISSSTANNSSKNGRLEKCANEHLCDQNCAMYKGRAICSCAEDYMKISNSDHGFRCQSNELSNSVLIYSTETKLKSLNYPSGKAVVINSFEGGVFTASGNDLYYTTYSSGNKVIFKQPLNSTTRDISVNGTILGSSITSIAVDYITNNVYFTTNTTLSVCSNSKRCINLINGEKVNHVTLAPRYQWMFYIKQLEFEDGYFIMKSNMNGSGDSFLVDGSYSQPTPLTVDESIKRIYWLDQGNGMIFSIHFFGGDSEIRTFEYTGKVVSIAALDSKLFFTKDQDNEIFILENNENFVKSNSSSGGLLNSTALNKRLVERRLTLQVQNLYAYNPIQQKKLEGENPCKNPNPPCDGLCLLRPNLTNLDHHCFINGTETMNRFWWSNSTLLPDMNSNTIPRNDNAEKPKESATSSTNDQQNKSSTPDKNKTVPPETIATSTSTTTTTSTAAPSSTNNSDVKSPTPTASENTASTLSGENQNKGVSIGWKIFGLILLVAFLVCGVYFYKRRGGYSHFSFRDFTWRRYNGHVNIQEEDL